MAIQYSISYDDKGSPSLVKNTIEGSKPVIKSSFNIGEYKPTRTIQTDFDFENVTEQNAETVYQSLQNYIYQTDKNSDGRPDDVLVEPIKSGNYELVFYVGEYFKKIVELENPNFLNEVSIKFGISNIKEKYHVPILVSPWSYSTYRGS